MSKRVVVCMGDIDDAGLNAYQFRVAHHVARRDGAQGCYEALESMAEHMGMAKGTVRKCLAELVEMGIVKRTDRSGTTPIFRINHDVNTWSPYCRNPSLETIPLPYEPIPSDDTPTVKQYGGVPLNVRGGVPLNSTQSIQIKETSKKREEGEQEHAQPRPAQAAPSFASPPRHTRRRATLLQCLEQVRTPVPEAVQAVLLEFCDAFGEMSAGFDIVLKKLTDTDAQPLQEYLASKTGEYASRSYNQILSWYSKDKATGKIVTPTQPTKAAQPRTQKEWDKNDPGESSI